MEVVRPPRGLIIDLITPLKKSGEIDGRGLGKQLDRVLPHVQGIFLASPHMGEGNHLNLDQRKQLVEKTLVVVRGKVPLFIWISRSDEKETTETLTGLQKHLDSRGYDGQVFWVDTPLQYHSNRGLPAHYRHLATLSDYPFLLHNDPEAIQALARPLKRSNIRTGILKELARITHVNGLIFLGSLERVRHYHLAVRARNDFRIYDGDESRFLNSPSMSGVVSAGANLSPLSWRKITASSLDLGGVHEKYPDQLHQIWHMGEYLRRLMDIYQRNPVPLVKGILSEMGFLDSHACISDTGDITEDLKPLREVMRQWGDIS
ncbi:MAG: dihydrodipicolinate synthase family protein [Deltaproteobacteria bacterium]|nr:dihydrodipicolinate synthase family protein [Deltaproteobacteria bacterium]